MNLHPCFQPPWFMRVCLESLHAETGKGRLGRDWTPMCFCGCTGSKIRPRPAHNIAVWQLCRERQPLWKKHDDLHLTCFDFCIVFVLMAQAPSKAGAKELLCSLHSNDEPWIYIHVFNHLDLCGFAWKAFLRKQVKVDSVETGHQCLFVVVQATFQDSPKARPRAILEWKNLIEQLNLLSQHAPICAIMCLHGPTLQFVSRAETDKFRDFSISSLFSTLKVIFAGLPRKAFPRQGLTLRCGPYSGPRVQIKILCPSNEMILGGSGRNKMKIDAHSTSMHRGLAYWMWAFFAMMPSVRVFCNSGWPDMRQSLPIDCLPILNKPHPYFQKTKGQ